MQEGELCEDYVFKEKKSKSSHKKLCAWMCVCAGWQAKQLFFSVELLPESLATP